MVIPRRASPAAEALLHQRPAGTRHPPGSPRSSGHGGWPFVSLRANKPRGSGGDARNPQRAASARADTEPTKPQSMPGVAEAAIWEHPAVSEALGLTGAQLLWAPGGTDGARPRRLSGRESSARDFARARRRAPLFFLRRQGRTARAASREHVALGTKLVLTRSTRASARRRRPLNDYCVLACQGRNTDSS